MNLIYASSHVLNQWRERTDKRNKRKGVSDEELISELNEMFAKSKRVKLGDSIHAWRTREKHGDHTAYYVATRKGTKWLLAFNRGSYLITTYKIEHYDDRWVDYYSGEQLSFKRSKQNGQDT